VMLGIALTGAVTLTFEIVVGAAVGAVAAVVAAVLWVSLWFAVPGVHRRTRNRASFPDDAR
jgi:uncharacterized membrane protein